MKKPVYFAVAVGVSLLIWLISNMLETTNDIVSVRVVAQSGIVGRSKESSESVTVTAAVNASGFSLLRLSMNRDKVITVTFDAGDLTHREGDFYTISNSALFKYASEIVGANVAVQSFLSHDVMFRFAREDFKKVPVLPVTAINCRPQYMLYGDMELSHDSVYVYGDPMRLESIERVMTRQIVHNNLDRSVHDVVALEVPARTRLSVNEVTYFQPVTRFVEYSATASLEVRNLPEGKSLAMFPGTVDVSYKFIFPISGMPASNVVFYVDYNEFATSLSGTCMVRCDGLPDVALGWETYPQAVDCVETSL